MLYQPWPCCLYCACRVQICFFWKFPLFRVRDLKILCLLCCWIQHGRSVWRLVCCTAPPCGDLWFNSNILTNFYHLKIPLTIYLFFFNPSSISLGHIRLGAQQQALQLWGGAGLRRQAGQQGSRLSHLPRRHRSWAGVRLLPGRLRHWQRLPFFPRGRVLERRPSAATTAHRRGLPRTLYADNLSLQRQHPQLWQQQVSEYQTTPKPKPLSTPITSRGCSTGGARLFRERGNSRKCRRSELYSCSWKPENTCWCMSTLRHVNASHTHWLWT